MKRFVLLLLICSSTLALAQDKQPGEWQQPPNTPVAGPCPSCKPNEKFEKNVNTPSTKDEDDKSDSRVKKGS